MSLLHVIVIHDMKLSLPRLLEIDKEDIDGDQVLKLIIDSWTEDYKKLEKKLKVLKIIKEKEPDISFLYRALNLKHYNSCVWTEQVLT